MAEENVKPKFGFKSVEDMEAHYAGQNQKETPAEPPTPTEPIVEKPNEATPTGKETPTQPPTPPVAENKVTWLEEMNKSLGLSYKSPDDFKAILEKAKMVDEYEPKVKGFEETEKKYKQQIEEAQRSLNPLSYFQKPENYVAEQLKIQRPELSPSVLQDVITRDSRTMEDIDVLVKDALLNTPNLKGGEMGVRETILSEFNIDPSTPQEEWSVSVQNRIMMRANQARKEWDELKRTVQLPKVMTPEEREAERVKLMTARKAQVDPIKDTFSKFEKFTEEIEEGKTFEFNVPDEYKKELPTMIEDSFLKAGVEPTPENIRSLEEIRDALLLKRHFKQIYKTIEGDVQTRERAKQDALLNNTTPPNTRTATEQKTDDDQYFEQNGFAKMFGGSKKKK